MKLIIAGSRDLTISYDLISGSMAVHKILDVREIVSGGCKGGADLAAKKFPKIDRMSDYPMFNYTLKYTEFPADWDTHGRAAGPIRNRQMAEYGDALLLIWDGESRGSGNMKKEMEKLNKPVYEIIIIKGDK